jgi:general secretion pathway protein I
MSRSIGSPAASPSRSEGFTLIEVLVAFVITATLLLAVLGVLTRSLEGGERSEAYTKATILAESTLDSIGLMTPLQDGDSADLDDGIYHVHASVGRYQDPEETTATTQFVVLYQVSAEVTWRLNSRESAVSLTTLKLGPVQ